MSKTEMKLLQQLLSDRSLYAGSIDGMRGPKTNAAISQWLVSQSSKVSPDWKTWSDKRKYVAALQLFCAHEGIDAGAVDGWYGPTTNAAAKLLIQRVRKTDANPNFVDISPLDLNPHRFPKENASALTDAFGKPGEVPLSKVRCPWALRLDWNLNQSTSKISIHSDLADSLGEVLEQIHDHYGEEKLKQLGLDRYGGSYNPRKKRGSLTVWSTHAWGVAIDWFPSKNKLSWRSDRATLAHSDLDFFWNCWEQQGWLSLGRAEDRDWMHVQAAKR